MRDVKSLAAEIEAVKAVLLRAIAASLNDRGVDMKSLLDRIPEAAAEIAANQSRAFEDGARWMRDQAGDRADIWLTIWGEREIRHTSARQYACGAVEDVKDAIAALPLQPEGERSDA